MPEAATKLVRVSQSAWKTLRDLSTQSGEPMQAIFDRAVEEYRRKLFLEEANRAFAALKSDPQVWEEELKERRAWEGTLADGLEEEE